MPPEDVADEHWERVAQNHRESFPKIAQGKKEPEVSVMPALAPTHLRSHPRTCPQFIPRL
jgi:hypothetical protein